MTIDEKRKLLINAVLEEDLLQLALYVDSTLVDSLYENSVTGESYPLICLAAKKGNAPIVEVLLDNGATIDDTCGYAATALMYAVANTDLAMVTMLVDRGADVNKGGDFGISSFAASLVSKFRDGMLYMLNHGRADYRTETMYWNRKETIMDFVLQQYNLAIDSGDKEEEFFWDDVYEKLHQNVREIIAEHDSEHVIER